MATGSLYGSVSESTGLYGIGAASGGTYFEWFIFLDSATAPATPTGGSWSFATNTGTAPSGWLNAPPAAPVNQVWVSIAVVDSRNASVLIWSIPGLMTGSGFPILSASGVPSAGTGLNGQLYINTATTPQSMYFKQSGAWTQLTGSTLYATAGANSNITSLSGLTGGISTADFVQFDTGITPTTAVGKLQWDPDRGGPQIGMVGGNVNLQIGQEEVVYVYNDTGSQINEGQVVKITGAQGQRVTVALAQANNDGNSATILGMATENIANNASGFVTTQGIVNNINTSGFAEGAVIYLSPTTPGGFTVTKPVAPNHLVLVGYIVKGNSGGGGSVFIHPQNGYELSELHDVLITSVANNNLLRYNSAVPAWVNIAGPSGTIVGTSDTQVLTNKTIDASFNTLSNIPNASLTYSSVSINGTPVSLGTGINITAETPNELIFSTGLSATSNFDGSQETTVSLEAVGTAGVYGSAGTTPSITVNTVGQVTNITPLNVVITTNNISGSVAIAQGGTGASSAKFAMQNLLPSYSYNNGKVLAIDAAGTDLEWRAIPGIGTVTSVDGSGGDTGLTLTGGPITAAGTLTLGGTLAVANGGTGAVNTADARTNLGLGSISTQDSDNVTITGGSISGITDLAIADGGTGASTAADARTNLGLGSAAVLNAGVAGGVATLDGGGTVPTSQLPAAVLGAVKYQGTWNASTNTPALTSSTGTQGYYYVVSVAGSTNLDGITDWKVGDWAIYNGTAWQKIDNTDAVFSVNGYTGTVVLSYTDVGAPSTSGTNATGTWGIGITGNAATVTDGVYTTGSYSDPTWITSLSGSKVSGNISGNAANVTGIVAVANGGTGVTTSTGTGSVVLSTSPTLVTPLLGTPTSGNFSTGTFTWPTFNQNTTGTALNVTGTVAIANGGTGQTTRQDAMDALAGAVTSGQYLRGNGTDVVMSAIQAADVPTLNQNTTGNAATATSATTATNVSGGIANVTTLTASADSSFTSTGAVKLSTGTTAERPTGAAGKLRFNITTNEFEGHNGTTWSSVGGSAISNDTSTATNLYPLFAAATTGTAASVYTSNAQYLFKPSTGELSVKAPRASNGIVVNSATVSENYTIATGDNGMSAGPVSVASGIAVTISSGSVWTVV